MEKRASLLAMKWIPLAMAFATTHSLDADSELRDAPAIPSAGFALDFEDPKLEPDWRPVNDGVMGGLSEGAGKVEEGVLVFEGSLSLENNGGFSSVRTPVSGKSYNFAEADGLALRVRGDGRTYQLRLATDARHRGSLISYQRKFETEAGEWQVVKVPFAEMKPGWRGRMLNGHVLDSSEISQLGILIGDKKEGPFRIEVDWMKSYREGEDS